MKYIFIFLLFLLIGINYVLIKKESFQVIDPRLEQIRLNKIEIKRIKSNVCTKNNIPLDRCKCNIAIVTHIFDKKVTQPLNKYSDIFNFSKNMNDYLIFWFIFDFPFYIEQIDYFFLELDYMFNIKEIKEKNDKLLFIQDKFYLDYQNIFPKGFIDIVLYKYKRFKLKLI